MVSLISADTLIILLSPLSGSDVEIEGADSHRLPTGNKLLKVAVTLDKGEPLLLIYLSHMTDPLGLHVDEITRIESYRTWVKISWESGSTPVSVSFSG